MNAVRDAIVRTENALKKIPCAEAQSEALFMVSNVLGINPAQVYLTAHTPLDEMASSILNGYMERRIRREPLQYIIGSTEFWGLPFKVNHSVLIPRPETEHVVEEALKTLKGASAPLVLDLCAGSGCIGISLCKELPFARVVSTDISESALCVARENALLNDVRDRMSFKAGDLFDVFKDAGFFEFDLIVSNPPYVKTGELKTLAPEITLHEPRIALDGGLDGLAFIRRIVNSAPGHLKSGGSLIFEIGYNQAEAVKKIIKDAGRFSQVEIARDYSGIDRIVKARRIDE